MDFLRKLLVFFIIIITTYILYRLYKKRQKILAGDLSEGFMGFGNSASSELSKMRARAIANTQIMNITDTSNNIPLNQYIIKSSYNSACSGKYFTTEAIQYVLSRGCRWLDFEVFYNARRQDIYVSKTSDPSFNNTPKNSVSFMDAMSTVISYGISSATPNYADPIFIQIRPKTFSPNAYTMISNTILSTFGNKLYGTFDSNGVYSPTPIDPQTTKLSSLIKKIIIVLDVSPNTEMTDIANSCKGQNCNPIQLANMIVGTTDIPKTYYGAKIKTPHVPYDVDFSKTPPTATVTKFEQVIPDDNSRGNMNMYNIIYYYGIQLTPGLFYYNDEELYNYEFLFENQRNAFMPLANANKYIGTTSQFNS
jgi:hypothetical protein